MNLLTQKNRSIILASRRQPARIFYHADFTDPQIADLMNSQTITIGGNKNLKIYGTLKCKSGKRMKRKNRVFFKSEQDAIACGYRPCGNCMRQAYINNNAVKPTSL